MNLSLLKKTFAAALATLTAFSCVACSGGNNGSDAGNNSAAIEGNTASCSTAVGSKISVNNTGNEEPKATMYMLKEATEFMMGFVIVTDKDNVIIVDGGRPSDMPNIKQYVGGRKIKAWILTHPHDDHISGFVGEMQKNGGADFDIEKVYYNFPCYEELMLKTADEVPNLAYFRADINESLPSFNAIKSRFADKEYIIHQGEELQIDDVHIEFLFSYHDGLYDNPMNDASLVFKLSTPKTSTLFLGDLGPVGGDVLLEESGSKLKADIVQMAHHGHMTVDKPVYEAVGAKVCLWSAPEWLYNEPADFGGGRTPEWIAKAPISRPRMYGTMLTREWMDELGATTHLVSGYGTQTVYLY